MVAINKILMLGCTGEGCGGDKDICADSRIHHCNSENRAPVTRNHRSTPSLWPSGGPPKKPGLKLMPGTADAVGEAVQEMIFASAGI